MATQHLPCCTFSPLLCMHYGHSKYTIPSSSQQCYEFEDSLHISFQLTPH